MNNSQFDPAKDTEIMPFEEVVAELSDRVAQPTDEEVLAAVLPQALSDGAMLIELKETKDADIKSAVILTLHEQQCPLSDQPTVEDPQDGVWAWNMLRGTWYYLQFSEVDAAGPFPPESGSMGGSD